MVGFKNLSLILILILKSFDEYVSLVFMCKVEEECLLTLFI